MAAWFILHPLRAKKMYITIVAAKEMPYMLSVEPMRRARQPEDS